MEDTTSIKKVGELRFFSPIEINQSSFSVGIYYDGNGHRFVNATDFLTALGIKKGYVETQIYHYINTLDLKVNVDYFLNTNGDPITHKTEHVFMLHAAQKIAAAVEGDVGQAAVQFLTQVEEYVEHDILRLITFDTLFHCPIFAIDVVAYLFYRLGYNNCSISKDNLVHLLKKDRLLTKALRPTKGNEVSFLRYNNDTYVTMYGLSYLGRKYLGLTNNEAIQFVLESMPHALRRVSSSLFNDSTICKIIPEETTA